MWEFIVPIIVAILLVILFLGGCIMIWSDIVENRCPKCKSWNHDSVTRYLDHCFNKCKQCKTVWKQVFD
jgi:hypothetical protein